jgi:hypothetical protein
MENRYLDLQKKLADAQINHIAFVRKSSGFVEKTCFTEFK